MAQHVETVTERQLVDDDNETVVRRSTDTVDADRGVAKTAQVVWFIVGVLVFLLVLRMILSLLGANPANAFADLIYSLSGPLVTPFRGLLSVGTVELGVSRFETETLVAIIVYTLIGWGIVKLIDLGRRDTTASTV